MEYVAKESISKHLEENKMIRNKQGKLIKSKLCLSNQIFIYALINYEKVIRSVDGGSGLKYLYISKVVQIRKTHDWNVLNRDNPA